MDNEGQVRKNWKALLQAGNKLSHRVITYTDVTYSMLPALITKDRGEKEILIATVRQDAPGYDKL